MMILLPEWSVILMGGSIVALVFLLFESLVVIRTLQNRIRVMEMRG